MNRSQPCNCRQRTGRLRGTNERTSDTERQRERREEERGERSHKLELHWACSLQTRAHAPHLHLYLLTAQPHLSHHRQYHTRTHTHTHIHTHTACRPHR